MEMMIHPQLVNGSFGDPLVYCLLHHVGRAFAFDMGASFELTNGDLQRLDTLYISHAHIDHLFGFEHLLRANVKLRRTIKIFGPAGIQKNIHGKLQGFTWNLLHGAGLEFEIHEISGKRLTRYSLRSRDKFKLHKLASKALSGDVPQLHKAEFYSVRTATLDHRIPSQAYSVTENIAVSINKDALDRFGYTAGAWLNELKSLAIKDKDNDTKLSVPLADKKTKRLTVEQLKRELVQPRHRNRISYVSDARLSPSNRNKILELAADSDLFLCEATFMESDRDKADETCHMTARETGRLAKEAGAKRLGIFHFSKKYLVNPQPLIDEASEAFGKPVEAYTKYRPLHRMEETTHE